MSATKTEVSCAPARHIELVDWYAEINPPLAQAESIKAAAASLGLRTSRLAVNTAAFQTWKRDNGHILPPADTANALPGTAGLLDALQEEKLLEFFLTLQLFPDPAGKTLLDVGCGANPYFSLRLASRLGADCLAVDPALPGSGMVDGVRYYKGFASAASEEFPQANLITLHCSFEMFTPPEMAAVLALAQAKLASGGMLLILPLYLAPQRTIYFDARAAFPGVTREDEAEKALRVAVNDFWGLGWTEWLSITALKRRLIDPYPGLRFELVQVTNAHAVTPVSFLRFLGIWRKK